MKRTQIHITEQRDARIAALAAERGEAKAAVIREILDRALDAGDPEGEARADIRATAGALTDAPDWATWLASVRGRSSDARLRELHE